MKKDERLYFENTILFTIAFIILFGGFVYFVGGIAYVAPPIKKYTYNSNIVNTVKLFDTYAHNHRESAFSISDTTGDIRGEYAIHATLNIVNGGHKLSFGLKFENNVNKKNTELSLTSAFDESGKVGGYSIGYPDVKKLVYNFERLIWLKINQPSL